MKNREIRRNDIVYNKNNKRFYYVSDYMMVFRDLKSMTGRGSANRYKRVHSDYLNAIIDYKTGFVIPVSEFVRRKVELRMATEEEIKTLKGKNEEV